MNEQALREFISSLRERADVLDGGKPIRTCSVHASARADAFRQSANELEAAIAASSSGEPFAAWYERHFPGRKHEHMNRWHYTPEDMEAAYQAGQAGAAPRILDLDLFRAQLVDGQIIKESDGEPWPLTKSEADQICDALGQRLDKVWPVRTGAAGGKPNG